MPVKQSKPITAGRRFMSVVDYAIIDKGRPQKSLTKGRPSKAGRDSAGRISVRHCGGRQKHLYRTIDFRRNKLNIPGIITSIEYDSNRSAFIALVKYADGEWRYILAAKGMKSGQRIENGEQASISIGNSLPLYKIPLGSLIHNVEMSLGRGGQLVRAAGTAATVVARENDFVTLRLPSGETRLVFGRCCATVGMVANEDHMNVKLGKAGRARLMGRRPTVRGVVMNPVDHPHGGGEGRTSGGRHPVTPWGIPTQGYKTRNKHKRSSAYIVKRRR